MMGEKDDGGTIRAAKVAQEGDRGDICAIEVVTI
jgi:hypothetical protein